MELNSKRNNGFIQIIYNKHNTSNRWVYYAITRKYLYKGDSQATVTESYKYFGNSGNDFDFNGF